MMLALRLGGGVIGVAVIAWLVAHGSRRNTAASLPASIAAVRLLGSSIPLR